MTLTMRTTARSIQVLGGLMTLTAVLVAAIAPYCGSSLHVQIGAVALLFDVAALLMKPGSAGAIPVAFMKVVLVGASVYLVVSCAPPLGYEPLIPQGVAQPVLLLSALPSILGAFMLRFAR